MGLSGSHAFASLAGMTRPDADATLLHGLGRAIARARLSRGWTQDTLAHALGISIKNAQRLESGKHDLRLTTVAHVAAALDVALVDLLAAAESPPPGEARRSSGPLSGLASTGWEAVRRAGHDATLVPIYDLRPRAGPLRMQAMPSRVGWARPPGHRHLQGEGYLLARVRGDSMAPEVPDGAWCLFHQPVAELYVRKRVLVRVADADPDSGGAWLLKCIGAIEASEHGVRVRLDSRRAHPPVWLEVREGGDAQVMAELVEVLSPPHAPPR